MATLTNLYVLGILVRFEDVSGIFSPYFGSQRNKLHHQIETNGPHRRQFGFWFLFPVPSIYQSSITVGKMSFGKQLFGSESVFRPVPVLSVFRSFPCHDIHPNSGKERSKLSEEKKSSKQMEKEKEINEDKYSKLFLALGKKFIFQVSPSIEKEKRKKQHPMS